MTQRITFTIDTEASYTGDEKVDLLDAFVAFITDADEDVVEDSETMTFGGAAENVAGITDAQKQGIIEDFLKNGNFEADIRIRAKGYANDGRFASGIISLDNE